MRVKQFKMPGILPGIFLIFLVVQNILIESIFYSLLVSI